MTTKNQVKKLAEESKEELVDVLSELIKYRSITGTDGEKEAVQYLQKKMEEFDYDEVFTDRIGNIVGKIGNGPKTIVYDAHIDVVDAEKDCWKTDPFNPVVKEGVLYGRGAMDDKGPLSCLLFGGKIIKELGLAEDYTVYILGSVSEETCEGLATSSFLEENEIDADYVVIAEASDLKICRGHRGRALIEAVFTGVPVHASRHNEGENPLDKALPFVQGVKELNKKLNFKEPLGKGDIVATKIKTNNTSLNTLASKSKVIIDRRTNTADTRESIIEELKELPNGDKADIDFIMYSDVSYNGEKKEGEEFFPAWVIERDDVFVKSGERAYQDLFAEDPIIDVWGFSTNGNYTKGKANIPTLGFGPGKEKYAHGEDERIKINNLIKAVEFYALLPNYL